MHESALDRAAGYSRPDHSRAAFTITVTILDFLSRFQIPGVVRRAKTPGAYILELTVDLRGKWS